MPVENLIRSQLQSEEEFTDQRSFHFKGQLQRFDKLSLFDRFRHVEDGFDINF